MIRIFILVILFIFSSHAKCIGWVGNAPQKAYCWEISDINKIKGKVDITVDVYGYPQNKPSVMLDNRYAKFISKKDIPNRFNIINFTRYKFSILNDKKSLKNSWIKVKEHNIIRAQKQFKE